MSNAIHDSLVRRIEVARLRGLFQVREVGGLPVLRREAGGSFAEAYPLPFGAWRVGTSPQGCSWAGYDRVYDYRDLDSAIEAMIVWDGEAELTGWTRRDGKPAEAAR